MSKAKTGDVLSCEVCGLTVIVDEECGCAAVGVICCEEPMINKGPAAPKKKACGKESKSDNKKANGKKETRKENHRQKRRQLRKENN